MWDLLGLATKLRERGPEDWLLVRPDPNLFTFVFFGTLTVTR